MSLASKLIICRSRRLRRIRLRQMIDLRDTDKSRYFAITEFNDCFIIRSPSLFFKEYLREAKRPASFSRKSDHKKEKSVVSLTHEQNSICSQKQLNDIAHEHTIVCRQLLAGHVVGVRPMKRKKHLHRMIIDIINLDSVGYHKVFHKRSSVDISPPTSWPPPSQTC